MARSQFSSHGTALIVILSAAGMGLSCKRPTEAPAASPAASAGGPSSQAPAELHGVDSLGMDRSVSPGDDFFRYANGSWLDKTEIPADRSGWSVAAELAEQTNLRLKALVERATAAEAAAGSEQRKVADYYASFMDEASIEAKGVAPLAPALAQIAALKSKRELARKLGEELRADVDPLNNTDFQTSRLFGLWVSPDFDAPARNAPYLLQGGLGLPDREYYLNDSARMLEIQGKYQAHIARVLELAAIPQAQAKAARILALETKLARFHVPRDESFDVHKANNPWQRQQFGTLAPGLDWATFFQAAGLERAPVITVWHPGAIRGLAGLVGSEPLATWQEWLTFHTLDRNGALLPKAFVDEGFEFYGKTLSGTPKLGERWKRGVSQLSDDLGDALGKLYVQQYFPPESKAQLEALVKNIVTAFGARIDKLEWMASATRAKAKAKLATLYVGVGYPDEWQDYSGLQIIAGDALGNADRAELFQYRRALAKLGQPVQRTEWWMAPQIVNALNVPLQNALNFPAAILQPPFFDPAATAALNYGAIGAVIGHEISHSFDDQGAAFDEQGKLADWWDKQDRAHFEAAGADLVAQYDAYQPFPDLHVNGKLTLGENIADLAGLAAAYDAWVQSLGNQPAPAVQGLSGDQQFFLAFAQTWRGKLREPALRQRLITDGHSPERYRAATVRNIDAWYSAFDVKPGQGLYLEPTRRVHVW
jgi:putative endopeptidase